MPVPHSDQLWMQSEKAGVVPHGPGVWTGIKKKYTVAQVLDMQRKEGTNRNMEYMSEKEKIKDHSYKIKGNMNMQKMKASPYHLLGLELGENAASVLRFFLINHIKRPLIKNK